MTARPRRRPVAAAHPARPTGSADLLLLQLAGLTEADESPDSLRSALIDLARPTTERNDR